MKKLIPALALPAAYVGYKLMDVALGVDQGLAAAVAVALGIVLAGGGFWYAHRNS